MKFLQSISAIFTAIIIMITSNGFMLENYFCHECEHEHFEISMFQFGEVTHDHCCRGHHDLHEHHHVKCLCHDKDHLAHTHIVFLSLKELFLDSQQICFSINFEQIICNSVIELPFNFKNINLDEIIPKVRIPKMVPYRFGGNLCTFISYLKL